MHLKTLFSRKDHVDSGLALLFLTLIAGLWFKIAGAYSIALAEIVVILIAPVVLYPFTFIWLNLSEILGSIMSRILLTAIFIIFVWPVGFIRRKMGKDSLMLKRFKTDRDTVFRDRKYDYQSTDFTSSY